MKTINGNVTSPIGFSAGGCNIGLKKDKKDMAVIVSEKMCTAAGCFTTNIVKAAPVMWDMEKVNNPIKGIVANSGNANACTGQQGIKDCEDTAARLAAHVGAKAENVLVCSTGVIGVNLDMDKILPGVDKTFAAISNDFAGGESASHAIMTTDTRPKTAAAEIEIGGKKVTLAGMAKGSGMINPNMATMLCFITTDCAIEKKLLDKALKACVLDTFNMISVDGDTSTNDTVLVLANGMAENPVISSENDDYSKFVEALFYINKTLAVMCADDGEGATKLMEVNVTGCSDEKSARLIAQSVTSSNLLKCVLFGEDANWGRVLCAMGYSGGKFDPMGVTINFKSAKGEINLMDNGTPIVFDEDLAAKILSEHNIYIDIILKEGSAKATAWGCDLTYDYVKINGDYRS